MSLLLSARAAFASSSVAILFFSAIIDCDIESFSSLISCSLSAWFVSLFTGLVSFTGAATSFFSSTCTISLVSTLSLLSSACAWTVSTFSAVSKFSLFSSTLVGVDLCFSSSKSS
uniref:Uncharacterized protein n=1 Tax=Cacopsylla melanoneura TaxID=428564 RepID=A0A8D8XG34_9HEMI